jgi:hypothetical protein
LIHFNPESETIVKSDASGYAIGAKLEQKFEGKFHPVTHASRMMTQAEQNNYCISEKEVLAIVYATNKFRHYLTGMRFGGFFRIAPVPDDVATTLFLKVMM